MSIRAAVARSSGGQMAVSRASARSTVVRQIEGTRSLDGRGGNCVHLGHFGVEYQCEEQVGVEPGSCEVGILGRQTIDMQDGLQPFDCQLNLPAQPIQGCEQLDRKLLSLKR